MNELIPTMAQRHRTRRSEEDDLLAAAILGPARLRLPTGSTLAVTNTQRITA
jgi:hypothetical protein